MKTRRFRLTSLLLTLVMVFTMLPAAVWAAEPQTAGTRQTASGAEGYQVVFSDGTEARMTEEELRAEAETHIEDENDTVTIEGTELTWGTFKSMLSVQDLQQLIDDGTIGGYDLTDEAHAPYTASLMNALLGANPGSAETVKVYLTKQSDNHYTVDTTNTANAAAYHLDNTTVYYVEDDAVSTDDNGTYVEIEADDFSRYDNYSEATMTISGDNGSLTVTASRTGSTELAAKLNYSVYVTKQKETQDGSKTIQVESGSITIPAGEESATKTVTLQDAQKSTKPEAAYVRFEAAENCVLQLDDNGSEIRGAACLMDNGYQSSFRVDGQTLQDKIGEEQFKELFSDLTDSAYSYSKLTRETANNYTAFYKLTMGDANGNHGNTAYNIAIGLVHEKWTLSYTVDLRNLAIQLQDNDMLPFTPYTFRARVRLANKNETQFRMYDVTDQANPKGLQRLTVTPNSSKICDYNSTTQKLADVYKIQLWENAIFSATAAHTPDVPARTICSYGDQRVYIYFYPEKYFDAAIPAGSGTTPVYLPGDVVPIMVRSTTDFGNGDAQSISVTYNAGDEKKTVTCSNVLGRYGSESGQYCAVLFGWTMPDDCTGGQLTLTDYKNGSQSVALVSEGSKDGQAINNVDCDIDYSNRTAAFNEAGCRVGLVDATGNESAGGGLALILPVKDNTIAWWEWIAGEANTAMQKGGQAPFALSSMYATFGEDSEKHPIYVHTKDGAAKITVQGQKVTVDGIVDYVYIPVETGRLSAVHLHYKGYNTSDSTVPNYKEDATGFIDAYLNNHKMFYSVVSGAGYEYAVTQYDPETKEDTKPEDQEYYTLADEDSIVLGYNATWNHFYGNDSGDDPITEDSVVKVVPPRVENYLAATPGAEPLTLTYTAKTVDTDGKKYTYTSAGSFRWVSSDPEIATVEGKVVDGVKTGVVQLTGNKLGEVTFTLVCSNGSHPVAVGSAKLYVSDSPDPYLYIPSTSATVTTRQGLGATVNFASNLTQRNANAAEEAANAATTTYTLNLYAVDGSGNKNGDAVYTTEEKATLESPVTSFYIPGSKLKNISPKNGDVKYSYIAEISAVYQGSELSLGAANKESYVKQTDGSYLFNGKATAKVRVKEALARVDITRPSNPNKGGEQSSFVLDKDNPTISWRVTPAGAQTRVEIKDAEGNDYTPSGSSYTFPKVPDGTLKQTYTVTVYATNDAEEDGWTVASSKIYVYNGDALDLLVYSVGYGNGQHSEQEGDENNQLLDETGKPMDSANIDNRRWLSSMLSEDGKTLDLGKFEYDLFELQNDVNLSAAITLNFGSYAWGMIADQIEWKAEKEPEDTGVLYYHQATQYVDVDDLALNSVFPTAEMIALATEDGRITVTATHAGTGQATTVTLDYNKVTDEFYMFQFFPKAKTTVTYFNGKGEEITVYSDDQGQLALLEPDSIDLNKPVYLRCITDVTEKNANGQDVIRKDVLFIGMIEPGDLRTGEVDAIENERYPINVHHLSEPGKVQIYLQKPDKTPLAKNVEVTYRGGAFYGDEPYTYAPKADIFVEANRDQRNLEDENLSNGLHDNTLATDADGALTFYFNLDQVTDGVDSIDFTKEWLYVFELQVPGYLPFVIRVDPYHSTVTEVLRSTQTEREIAVANKYSWVDSQIQNSPITNAIMVDRGKEVEYAPLSGNTSRIGNNGQYQSAVLEYETLLWNDSYRELMSEDETTKQWSVTGETDLNQYFYDRNASTKLGNGFTEQYKKQTSEVWCFPFSTWPLITTKLTMDPETFGVNADGSSTGRTWLEQYHRTRSNVYLKDGEEYLKQMNFEYFIFNGTGMLEPLNSARNMAKLQETIDSLSDDMNSFHLADEVSDGVLMTPVKDIARFADGVLKETTGFRMEPYFAATLDPAVYYVFLNMKTTPRQEVFSTILSVSDIAIDEYVEPNDSNGINAAYGEYQKLFDKLKEPRDEQGKIVGLDSFADRHKSITFDTGGSLLLRAEFDPVTESWSLYYISGTVDSFLQVGFKLSFSPVPMVNLGIGTFVGADKLFKAQNRVDANDIQRYDLIRQLSVGGGINVSGGIGIPDLGIVEVQLCVVGSIKYTYSNAKLKSTLYRAVDDETDQVVSQDGKNHKMTGMIGLQLEVGVGPLSTSYSFASFNFDIAKWPTPEYDKLRNVWEGKAKVLGSDGQLLSANYTATLMGDDTVSLQFEQQSLNIRNMLFAVNAGQSLFKTYENEKAPKNIVLDDSGAIFFLDDHVASWADAEGVAQGGIVEIGPQLTGADTLGDFGHSYLDASGSDSNRFAVWSTQTQEAVSETGLGSDIEVTAQDIGAALKSTEITAAYYNGSTWTAKKLTENTYADVLPKVASSGSKAVVIWQQGESSGNGETIFDAGKFDVDSRIMMSKFDGTDWSAPQTLFSTAAVGELGNMNLALLNDSTAIIAYTLGEDINNKDVFYSIVNLTDGSVTSYRATEDDVDDTNVQVQAVGNGEAVLAWYNAQTSETGVTGDVHLLGVKAGGTLDDRIPESIGVAGEAEVNSDFRLGGSSLNGLTVAWILSDEVPENASVGSGALYGVQLYSDADKTVVSPVQRLGAIASGTDVSITGFEMLANGQSVTAVLEEKDYTTGQTETYTMDTGDSVELPVGDDKLETKTGSFTDTLEVSDPVYSEELAAANSELPVSYTVRNHGVHKITALTLNGQNHDVTLYPGESTVLTETVTFSNAVQDHDYTITAVGGSYEEVKGTIRFNVPKVSVQEVSVREVSLSAAAGNRTVDVTLGNNAGDTLPISGSGKTLTVQLFSDMEGEHAITDAQTVEASAYRRVDNSSVTVSFDTTVDAVFKSLGQTGDTPEIPESGLPVFAIAQVMDGDTVLNTSVNMTALKPMTLSDDEGSVETQVENWKQDIDEEAKTNTATVVVSFTNTSLKNAEMPKYTLVKVFDEDGLLLAEHFKENNGTVNAEGLALDEITVNLPTGKTVSLITAETADEIDLDKTPTASGYRFSGWYNDTEYKEQFKRETEKDEDGKDKKDENGNLIYAPITVGESGTLTVYGKWTRNSYSGGTPTTTITVPVSGEEETVSVTATVKDSTATITAPTDAQMEEIVGKSKETGAVAIDLSSLSEEVTAVSIPAETVKAIDEAMEMSGEGLTIKLPDSTVNFDPEALAAIAEQTTGKDLKLNVDPITESKLNAKQKEAVADLDVQAVYDIYLTSDGNRITDFGGGKAAIQVTYQVKDGQQPGGIEVWYVADEGGKTWIPKTATVDSVSFTVSHFSNYVLTYDETLPGACAKDDDCPMTPFTDLDKSSWYHDGVHWALENSVMNGMGDNKFDPNGTTSRAMIVTMLYRMEGEPEVTSEMSFDDVPADTWYTGAVAWAEANGIVNGVGNNKFAPNTDLTREQLVTILQRYANYKGIDTSAGEQKPLKAFDDTRDISDWADKSMRWAVDAGIINGTGNRKISPQTDASRAQVATMLMRYCTLLAE